MGERSILGLNFRMNELTGAVALAQLRKLDAILATLREKKSRFRSRIADVPGVRFRKLPDPDGECATLCTVIFENPGRAAAVAARLGTTRSPAADGTSTPTWSTSGAGSPSTGVRRAGAPTRGPTTS